VTTTLRVIADDVVAGDDRGLQRYAEELCRALIESAPHDCEVEGVVSAAPDAVDEVSTLLPGLARVSRTVLGRRELHRAWQHGITSLPGSGMVHSPSLLAPLRRHDRVNDPSSQTVVTVHDAVAWTHPELLSPRRVAWTRAMARRAERHADAVIVPTYGVADDLEAEYSFGDRLRVIGGGVSAKLRVPVDADDRARRLALPERFLLATGGDERRSGLDWAVRSLGSPDGPGLPLLVAGDTGGPDDARSELAGDAGVDPSRIVLLGDLADSDLAVALGRATALLLPALAGGWSSAMLEAFHLGTPVIHSDVASYVEVAAGSGRVVPTSDLDSYPELLAQATAEVAGDADLSRRLSVLGQDRASAFSWRDTGQRIWQLHADL